MPRDGDDRCVRLLLAVRVRRRSALDGSVAPHRAGGSCRPCRRNQPLAPGPFGSGASHDSRSHSGSHLPSLHGRHPRNPRPSRESHFAACANEEGPVPVAAGRRVEAPLPHDPRRVGTHRAVSDNRLNEARRSVASYGPYRLQDAGDCAVRARRADRREPVPSHSVNGRSVEGRDGLVERTDADLDSGDRSTRSGRKARDVRSPDHVVRRFVSDVSRVGRTEQVRLRGPVRSPHYTAAPMARNAVQSTNRTASRGKTKRRYWS